MSQLTEQQKLILKQIGESAKAFDGSSDFTYALRGLLTEISHLGNDEYFDSSYIAEKGRIVHQSRELPKYAD